MILLDRTAPDRIPAPALPSRTPRHGAPRLLAVVADRETALDTLDRAYTTARETGCEVHTALFLPRTPFTLDASLLATLTDEADREASELVALAGHRAAAADVPARISVHRIGGLRGRRRRAVLDRAVTRLARRLDAVPVGWTSP